MARTVSVAADLAAGEQLQLWARGTGAGAALRILDAAGVTLYAVGQLAEHCEHHRFAATVAGTVTIEWTPDLIEFGYACSFVPERALRDGVAVWVFGPDGLERLAGAELAVRLRAEPDRPQLHFSPPRQWMNDPNGLSRIDGRWHLFYQFHPGSTAWGPMHWGHAVSDDLVTWTNLPVFMQPQHDLPRLGASGGAFSGSACAGPDGRMHFCHTERLPCFDEKRGVREVQRIVESSDLLEATAGATVLAQRPPGASQDFRDPKLWWHEPAGEYRMVLGSALDGDPAALLYGSSDLAAWRYLGPLWRAPASCRERGADAAECPDFFELDGKWVLLFSLHNYTDPATGRRNPTWALVGDFEDDVFTPGSTEPQELDFGGDYYAMQTCAGDGRRLAFAWLHNWTAPPVDGGNYRGEQSLPRELFLADGKVGMRPAREIDDKLRRRELKLDVDGCAQLADAPFEVRVAKLQGELELIASAAGEEAFAVRADADGVEIGLSSDASGVSYRSTAASLRDLRIFYDRGIIEVFAAGGRCCGTRRLRLESPVDACRLRVGGTVSVAELGLPEG